MSVRPLDDLLDETLATGAVPSDASDSERSQLEALSEVVATIRATLPVTVAEAEATIPVARARFERFVAAQSTPTVPPARPRASWHRTLSVGIASALRMTAIRAVAVVAVVAILGLFLSQVFISDVSNAAAQVITPGDYVQLEGTVTAQTADTGVQRVHIVSNAGEFDVDVSTASYIVSGNTAVDASAVHVGDHVLIGGVVAKNGQIGVSTLVLSRQATVASPIAKLRVANRPMAGRVVSFSLSADLRTARVVLDDGNGGLYLAKINRKAAEALLLHSVNALGTHVELVSGGGPGLFSLQIVDDNTPTPAATPSPTRQAPAANSSTASPTPMTPATSTPATAGSTPVPTSRGANATSAATSAPVVTPPVVATASAVAFVQANGVIVSRSANILRVQTSNGLLLVVVRPDTRILTSDGLLTAAALAGGQGNPVGYTIAVAGPYNSTTGRLSADLIVVGQKSNSD